MATDRGTRHSRARTGQQFLDGLRGDAREVWMDGEKITHPLEHPALAAAARSIARVFDLQHEHADEMLSRRPTTASLVNVTHVIPRSQEDLAAAPARVRADRRGRPAG